MLVSLQLSVRASLDSGYCSSAAINNVVNIIPEVEEKVLSPDSGSKMSYTLQMSSPAPSISSCDVTSDTPGASQADNLLQVNVLEEEKVTSHLVFKKSVSNQHANSYFNLHCIHKLIHLVVYLHL